MLRYLLPLGIFLALALLLGIGLKLDPREVPSPLIDKPAPAFSLPRLDDPARAVSNEDLRGRVWLLNVWASWCTACVAEHRVITALADTGEIPIIGLNYKDQSPDARRWLRQHGDPYVMSLADGDGRVGIDWGVYGVPETFLIDQDGIVRHKHIGPVTWEDVQSELLPMIRALKARQS